MRIENTKLQHTREEKFTGLDKKYKCVSEKFHHAWLFIVHCSCVDVLYKQQYNMISTEL